MPTFNKEFNAKNGLSVANTVIVDSNRNLINIANATVTQNLTVTDSIRISGYGNVVASNGGWTGLPINTRISSNLGTAVVGNTINFTNTSSVTVAVTQGVSGNINIALTATGVSGGGGGNANLAISDAAPSGTANTSLWWQSNTGKLKIYYSDGDSSQWVDAYTAQAGPQGVQGNQGSVGLDGIYYQFATGAIGDPPSGFVKYNDDSTLSSVTQIRIHNTANNGTSVSSWLSSFLKNKLVTITSNNQSHIFSISNDSENMGTYHIVPVTYISGSSFFNSNQGIGISLSGFPGSVGSQGFQGAQGAQGSQGNQGATGNSLRVINYIIDGGGTTITTGTTASAQSKGYISVPFNCNITDWRIFANTSGSCEVDVYTSTYAAFPTMTLISGTNPPLLSAAQKNTSPNITGWSSGTILAGNVIEFRVNSSPTVTVDRVTVSLNVGA